jgi:hypothetical protein
MIEVSSGGVLYLPTIALMLVCVLTALCAMSYKYDLKFKSIP